jgi:proteasome accessory factor B
MDEEKRKLKKRIRRCWGILVSALTQKGSTRKTLAAEYECSIRMISLDIALLRDIGFPIKSGKHGYTLSVKDLKIPPLPLDEEQVLTLFIASQLLVLTPLEEKASEAVKKMLSVLSEDIIEYLRNLTDRVYIAPGGDLGDTKILLDVYRAVSECQSIQIYYQALSTQQEEVWNVEPYGIYIKDRARSYLIGYTYEQGRFAESPRQFRRFKLCRITNVTFRNMRFTYPNDFSIRKEMAKGFWTGDRDYAVLIRFQPEVAQLVYEREPADHIETFPGGWVQVRKTVRNLDEVFYDILRYGRQAEVIEPPELRERMRLELEVWVKNYRD